MKSWRIFSTPRGKGLFWIGLTLLTLAVSVLSLGLGSVTLRPGEVLRALLSADASSTAGRIVLFVRLPRLCAALLAGSALAVSGTVIQTVLHNPLASPGVIGVNSSAGLAVALVCAVAPSAQAFSPLAAFLGALAGVGLVVGIAQSTSASRMTLVLAGVAVSNLLSAGIDAVVTLVPEALTGVTDFRIGGFTGVTMEALAPAAGMILPGIGAVLLLSREMDILSLGEELARSLGLRVRLIRFVLLMLAALLAGAAVSFAGLLGFVGLIVPHAMRRLVGEERLPLTAGSALGGACFVTVCDLLARTLFAPYELPVGIVLSFTGGPFFLWLLLRHRGGKT